MSIERFLAAKEAGLVHVNTTRYIVRDLYAYRASSISRSFIVLRWHPDEPTGLYPDKDPEYRQQLIDSGLRNTESYGVWNGEFVTHEEMIDGYIYRNGSSVQISATQEIRNLEPGAIVIASKFSAIHGSRFDRERRQFLDEIAKDGFSAMEKLVRRVERLPRIDNEDGRF